MSGENQTKTATRHATKVELGLKEVKADKQVGQSDSERRTRRKKKEEKEKRREEEERV